MFQYAKYKRFKILAFSLLGLRVPKRYRKSDYIELCFRGSALPPMITSHALEQMALFCL